MFIFAEHLQETVWKFYKKRRWNEYLLLIITSVYLYFIMEPLH